MPPAGLPPSLLPLPSCVNSRKFSLIYFCRKLNVNKLIFLILLRILYIANYYFFTIKLICNFVNKIITKLLYIHFKQISYILRKNNNLSNLYIYIYMYIHFLKLIHIHCNSNAFQDELSALKCMIFGLN